MMRWLASVVGVIAVLFGARQRGVNAERAKQEARRLAEQAENHRRHIDDLRKVREKRDEMDNLSGDDVARRLRDKWTRADR